MTPEFLPQKANYQDLICYKKSEVIYDLTFYFAHKFLDRSDRTIDQMVQAARSCKQNIVEGSAAAPTSKETEIKLTNVAKASLQELLQDYQDYLRVRNLPQWPQEDPRHIQARQACKAHNDIEFYRSRFDGRSAETLANIAIIIIKQTDYLLYRLIERQKQNFLETGGIREQMTAARLRRRERR